MMKRESASPSSELVPPQKRVVWLAVKSPMRAVSCDSVQLLGSGWRLSSVRTSRWKSSSSSRTSRSSHCRKSTIIPVPSYIRSMFRVVDAPVAASLTDSMRGFLARSSCSNPDAFFSTASCPGLPPLLNVRGSDAAVG
eukprot:scaffold10383_cov117-Isochrysis_galbana.AAC.3